MNTAHAHTTDTAVPARDGLRDAPRHAGQTTPTAVARAALRAGLPDRYLTPDDIAQLFGVPLETVYAWRKKHTGPPGFRVGRHIRYDPAKVHTWATRQQATDTAA